MDISIIILSINNKYKNNVLPIIPELLISYLSNNECDLNKFLNPKIKINNLLYYLKDKDIKDQNELLKEIINFINQKENSWTT